MANDLVLIVEARFYEHISDNLLKGVVAELEKAGVAYERMPVPGILEIPAAVNLVVEAMAQRSVDERYAGFIVLGCAIRGQTDHYEHVCRQSFEGVQALALRHHLAVGSGLLTVHNEAQALDRALPERKNVGGMAARACLRMIGIKRGLSLIA